MSTQTTRLSSEQISLWIFLRSIQNLTEFESSTFKSLFLFQLVQKNFWVHSPSLISKTSVSRVLLPLPFQILELSGPEAWSSIHRLWMQHCNLLLVSNFCCAAAVSPLASATCKQGRKFKINFHFRCALSFQSAGESCVERRKQRQNFFNSSEGRDAALNGSPRVLNFELRTWRLNLHRKEEEKTHR